MSDSVYIDTSALAKWYLNEVNSQSFVDYLKTISRPVISHLTITEMRSLLARRRRMHEITPTLETQIFATFLSDIDHNHLIVEPFESIYFEHATHLISSLPEVPLRSLDALHLSLVKNKSITRLATADQIMIIAANALEINVQCF